MQGDSYDQRGAAERLASLRLIKQTDDARSGLWLSLEGEHRCAQSPFIDAAGARGGERLLRATTTAYMLKLFGRCGRRRRSAAFPAERILLREEARLLPAGGAGYAVRARLDAGTAHGAGLRVEKRQRRVVERTDVRVNGFQRSLSMKGGNRPLNTNCTRYSSSSTAANIEKRPPGQNDSNREAVCLLQRNVGRLFFLFV